MPSAPHAYLHGHHGSVPASHRSRTPENSAGYLLPHLPVGAQVLDVGCGPGTITVGLAARAAQGRVIGIDAAPDVLDVARRTAADLGQSNVSFGVGDAYHLAFDDGVFDVVHAHQVLQHLSDPVAALVEMRRVCRPGGVVAARDGDYGGMFWFPEDPELSQWQDLYQRVARALAGEPDAGRRMLSWARAAGFAEDRVIGQFVVLRHPGGPVVVGRAVGGADHRVGHRRPGRRAWPRHPAGPAAAGAGVAPVGGERGWMVPHPARRDPLPRLTPVSANRPRSRRSCRGLLVADPQGDQAAEVGDEPVALVRRIGGGDRVAEH